MKKTTFRLVAEAFTLMELLVLSVDAKPRMTNGILAGDRNLEVSGQAVRPGLLAFTTNAAVRWTRELHTTVSNI